MSEINWVAQDADGLVFGYECLPVSHPDNGGWLCITGAKDYIIAGVYNPNWAESLVDLNTHTYTVEGGVLRKNSDVIREASQAETTTEQDVLEAHPLYPVYMDAIRQAAFGKGERHGGNDTPFLEQPWVLLAEQHGRGFLTGQAAKKMGEAPQKDPAGFRTEVLGALNYGAMSLIFSEGVKK